MILEDDMYVENIDDNKLLNVIEQNSNSENIEMLQIYNNSHPFIIKMYNEEFLKKNNLIIKRIRRLSWYWLLFINKRRSKKNT